MSGTADPFTPTFTVAFGASAVTAQTITNLKVATITAQRVGVAFTVSGTFQITASLIYTDDKGTSAISVPETFTFSFVRPGYKVVGTQTLTVGVAGGVSAKSNAFRVVKA